MRIETLKHLATSAIALVPGIQIYIFGSTSALCTFPDLPDTTDAYENTLDADFVLDPWSPEIAAMLDEVLGKTSLFFEHYKYYADINRPAIFDNFPADFRDRLVPLEGCPNVWALNPHDMAVSKLLVGRPKDLRLLSILLATGRLDEALVRKLLWGMDMEEKWIIKSHAFLDEVVKAAWDLGYPLRDVKDVWRKA